MSCPCGSGKDVTECCGPFLKGSAKPPTAEQLMRSRYTAFATGDVDYIMKTHDPDTVEEIDRDETKVWSEQSEWLGLEILGTSDGGESDETGTVDFVARYRMRGLTTEHRERAEFRKVDGAWVFSDGGEIPREKPVKQAMKWVPRGKKRKKAKK